MLELGKVKEYNSLSNHIKKIRGSIKKMAQKIMRKKKPNKAPMLILFALIIILVGIIVTIFSIFVKEDMNGEADVKSEDKSDIISEISEEKSTISVEMVDSLDTVNSNDNSAEASGETSEESATSEPNEEPVVSGDTDVNTVYCKVETTVPKTETVDISYFDDALFIGDSISKGLWVYEVLPKSNVIADQNVGINQIVAGKAVYNGKGGQKVTLYQAIEQSGITPKKLYILLGSNGIPGFDNEYHIEYYYQLIDEIKAKYPNTIIYVQSVTPITKAASSQRKTFTTEKINNFNELVYKMAKDKDVYFLNVEDALMDENGRLKADYAGKDGIHMLKSGYVALLDYYKNHVVQADGYAKIPQ